MEAGTVVRRVRPGTSAARAGRRRSDGFRADVQALRALAVTLVVLNHLWPTRLTGGYVGVDVFFVISGFLISSHLIREITATGRVRLTRFYARRIRRLLPAAFTVLVFIVVAAYFLVPAAKQNLRSATLAAGYAATQDRLVNGLGGGEGQATNGVEHSWNPFAVAAQYSWAW